MPQVDKASSVASSEAQHEEHDIRISNSSEHIDDRPDASSHRGSGHENLEAIVVDSDEDRTS